MSSINQVAVGRRVLTALAFEDSWQQGGTGLRAYDPVLPTGGRLRQKRTENPAVNRGGVKTKGTPSSVEGEYPFEAILTAELALHFGYAVLGDLVSKGNPAASVFEYDFENAAETHADISFFGLGGQPPIYRQQLWGMRFMDFSHVVEDGKVSTLKAAGKVTHGTELGPAQPDPANTGTAVPIVRGRMADPDAGDLYVRITGTTGGGVQFETAVSEGAPAWPGTFTYAAELTAGGDHQWQNVRDQDGQDVGRFDEAMVPVEIFFGGAAKLGQYAVGDVFTFERPGSWQTPALVQAGGRGFTNAHYRVDMRRAESADPWTKVRRSKSTITTSTELHESREDASNFALQLYHTGVYDHRLDLERDYAARDFDILHDNDQLVEVRHGWTGKLLDAATETREKIEFHLPAMEITSLESPASNAGVTKETAKLEVRPDPAGGAPIRFKVITDVDWTPPGWTP